MNCRYWQGLYILLIRKDGPDGVKKDGHFALPGNRSFGASGREIQITVPSTVETGYEVAAYEVKSDIKKLSFNCP